MANDYLSYTSRDFNSIKEDLTNSISNLTNIWTNRDQSDPGMVLVTLMSALGDNLSFNIDKQSLEFFGRTVSQRKNAKYVFDLLGYKMHWYKSAKLNVTVTNTSPDTTLNFLFNPTNINNTQRLVSSSTQSTPPYFLLNPNESVMTWDRDYSIQLAPGMSHTFSAIQGTLSSLKFSSSAIDENNRYYLPVTRIDQDHMWLTTETRAYQWYLTNNINEVSDSVARFEFDVDEYSMPYLQFVPNWREFGIKDNTEATFTLYYISTYGANGSVTSNILDFISNLATTSNINGTDIYDSLSITHGTNAYYTDILANVPGSDPETASQAYLASRNVIGTYNTLVTIKDFERFFKTIGAISNSFAVDGQRALDINETIADRFNYLIMEKEDISFVTELPSNDINTDKIYMLVDDIDDYTSGAYKYIDKKWQRLSNVDENGFKPYTVQMHLVAGNFIEKDPLDSSKSYAKSEPHLGQDSSIEQNQGWMQYSLDDSIIGEQDSSLISQTNLDDIKLISAEVDYGSVRKFPFFIDGKIHLKEKMYPQDAAKVLQRIYSTIYFRYIAANLEFGKKIGFANMISTIISADPAVSYFDAGANNSNGSLFIYPQEDDLNPYDTDEEGNPKPYGININPKYFNPVSLQHYEDILYNNNKYMYWCETASKHLSIDKDSILDKTTPYISDISSSVNQSDGSEEHRYIYKMSLNKLPLGMSNLFEFAFVKSISTNGGSLASIRRDSLKLGPWQDSNTFNEVEMLKNAEYLNNKDANGNIVTKWYSYKDAAATEPESQDPDTSHFLIAFRMKETLSTHTSIPSVNGTNVHPFAEDDEN